jgi:hypothetical protein
MQSENKPYIFWQDNIYEGDVIALLVDSATAVSSPVEMLVFLSLSLHVVKALLPPHASNNLPGISYGNNMTRSENVRSLTSIPLVCTPALIFKNMGNFRCQIFQSSTTY